MPIFELDEGRPRLVQPMQPLPGSFGQDCAALLTNHLAAVAGEPLFVVRARAATNEHADVPELLALDSTGRPVIVEVVQVVDDDAVVTALRHAGAAARMTTTDLARAYHPDPSRFPVDFAAFREQVAFGATTSRREGVRLVLLCSEVAAEAGDTLGFLRGPGRHVDVLQVGVVRGVDDSRLIDVSPLATHETVRRSVEPTALRLVRSSEAFATAMAYDSGRVSVSRPPMPGAAATPPQRVSSPDAITPVTGLRVGADHRPPASSAGLVPPVPPAPASPAAPTPASPAASAPASPAARVPVASPASRPVPPAGLAASPADGYPAPPANGHDGAPTNGYPTAPAGGSNPAGTPVTPPTLGRAGTTPGAPVPASFVPTSSFAVPAPHLPAVSGGPRPLTPAAGAVVAPSPSALLPTPPAAAGDAAEPEPAPEVDAGVPLPELTTLAKRRRAITTIVWYRERRNQRLVAMLRNDGLIELPDGRTFADPDLAAAAAAGSHARVDGWRSWRMGDGGPTLAEAAGVPTA